VPKDKDGISRRDLLTAGAAGAGWLLMNPLGIMRNFLGEPAYAADVTHVPFLVVNAIGGAALPGHFVPLSKTREFLPTYSSVLGRNTSESGAIDTQFGTPMFVGPAYGIHSEFMRIISADARKKMQIVNICHAALVDVPNNMSALRLVAGISPEKIFKNGFGTADNASGSGRNTAIGASNQTKPLLVRTANDVVSAVKAVGPLAKLSDAELGALLDSGVDLASLQLQKMGNDSVSKSVRKAYEDNASNARKRILVDPKDSQDVAGVFGRTLTGRDEAHAAILFNIINGNAPGAVVDINDCDYHNGQSRDVVINKDKEIGRVVAQGIELAHRMKKPFFFQIITDGGCSPGGAYWGADDGNKNVTVIGWYHPDGAKKPAKDKNQIGQFTGNPSIGADISTFVGNSPDLAGIVSFANYMAFSDRMAELEAGLKNARRNVNFEDIKKHIVFG
jgi:hypothetical protein